MIKKRSLVNLKKKIALSAILVYIANIVLFSNSFAIDTIYRFFPVIDDKNAVISIQPSAKGLGKYEIITNVSQYENLPKFDRMLLELWKKQPDGTFVNIGNEVYTSDKIKDEGIVGSFTENLNYLGSPIIEGDTVKKEYVTFKKIEIPYYKGDNLQKTYFDVSFKSMNIIHEKSSDGKVYPIKIVKKNYNKATEVQLTLDDPKRGKSEYKYEINIDTNKLPYEIKQLLADRKFDKLYIRDSKHNYYNFIVGNKYQFGLNYSSDYPKQYGSDPGAKSFIKLGTSYYYFSDLGRGTPTSNDIETMVNACLAKGGRLDSGNEIVSGNNTVLDYFISKNNNRKAYGVFSIRICKKDSPVYSTFKIYVKVPSKRFDSAGKLTLYLGIAENVNPSKVSYGTVSSSDSEYFGNYANSIVPIIIPETNLIFDETMAGITPHPNDKLKIDVLNNKIYYYEYDADYERYKAPKEFLPNSLISKDILIVSNKNAQYKVQVDKYTNRYKMLLDMTPYPFGEYKLKLTPIYNDNYFIKFKAVSKCYPEMITDADKLLFGKIKDKNGNLLENKITDILKFKDDLFKYIVNKGLYNNILLYQDKLLAACKDIPNNKDLAKQINNLYLSKVGARTLSNSNDLQQVCYFLVNNGKFTNIKSGTSVKYDLTGKPVTKINKLTLELTPKKFSKDLSYNLDQTMVPGYKPTTIVKYKCITRDENTGTVSQYNMFEQIQLYRINKIGRTSYNTIIPYNADTIRYYYSY